MVLWMNTLVDRLHELARVQPDALFLRSDFVDMTWRELAEASLRMSSLLCSVGVNRGDHVVLLCSNRPAFLVAFFAILNRGAVAVTVNTALVDEGLRYAVRQSDAKTIVIEDLILDEKRADIEPVLEGRALISLEGETQFLARLSSFPMDEPGDGRASDPCTIIYTSGTTGPPKAVLNSHRAYLACGELTVRLLQLSGKDRIMVFLPLFHANPQMYAVASSLVAGCGLAICPKMSISRLFEDSRRFGCTIFTYVGTVLAMLVSRITWREENHHLRGCIGGGAPQEIWQAVEERFGILVHELYGMSEIGGWVTGNGISGRRMGSCGLPRGDVEIRIFDSEDRPLPRGARGEIVVRPREPNVIFSGYYNDAQATCRSARNLWFHTGDLGSFDSDGFLYFHGRNSEIIKRGGENIAPAEIEAALRDHPDIEDVAVVAVPDAIYGEEIKAVIVRRREFAPEDVHGFLNGKIPRFMLPRYVQFVQAIPKTETQKVKRNLLQGGEGAIDLLITPR
jgi:crotonobetaine/carnitine-CoA ligase